MGETLRERSARNNARDRYLKTADAYKITTHSLRDYVAEGSISTALIDKINIQGYNMFRQNFSHIPY